MIFEEALIQLLKDNGIDPRNVDPALIREDRDKYRAALATLARNAATGAPGSRWVREVFRRHGIDPAELDPPKGAE